MENNKQTWIILAVFAVVVLFIYKNFKSDVKEATANDVNGDSLNVSAEIAQIVQNSKLSAAEKEAATEELNRKAVLRITYKNTVGDGAEAPSYYTVAQLEQAINEYEEDRLLTAKTEFFNKTGQNPTMIKGKTTVDDIESEYAAMYKEKSAEYKKVTTQTAPKGTTYIELDRMITAYQKEQKEMARREKEHWENFLTYASDFASNWAFVENRCFYYDYTSYEGSCIDYCKRFMSDEFTDKERAYLWNLACIACAKLPNNHNYNKSNYWGSDDFVYRINYPVKYNEDFGSSAPIHQSVLNWVRTHNKKPYTVFQDKTTIDSVGLDFISEFSDAKI